MRENKSKESAFTKKTHSTGYAGFSAGPLVAHF